jgi:ADP-heptose:LPS heptosyltransferase
MPIKIGSKDHRYDAGQRQLAQIGMFYLLGKLPAEKGQDKRWEKEDYKNHY